MPHGTRHKDTSGVNGTTLATSDPAKNLTPPAYSTDQAITFVGATTVTRRRRDGARYVTRTESVGGTRIYHKTVVSPSPNGSGSTTDFYIQKDGKWQKAATSTDGGKTYTFQNGADGKPIAGDALRKELNDPQGAIHKNVNAQVTKAAEKNNQSKADTDAAVDTNKNIAQTEPENTAPKRIDAKDVNAAIGSNKAGTRNKFPMTLTYPLSLRDSKQDKIQFNMIEYVPGEIGQGQLGINRTNAANVGSEAGSGSKSDKTIGRVFLPIPSGISDTTGAGWGEDRMNAAQLATAAAALGFIEQGGSGLVKSIEDTLNSVSAYSDDVKKAIATQVAGSASGTGPGLLTRTTGAVLNPNLELLFQGPTLRPFDFVFKLSARSQKESDEIIKIIRFFKQGMAPIRSESNLFLKSPHTFKIRYLHDNKDHPFLNKFKICALKSLTVNYTPDGNYATFRDGKMVSYELNMSFQELDPIFNDDYTKLDDNKDTQLGF